MGISCAQASWRAMLSFLPIYIDAASKQYNFLAKTIKCHENTSTSSLCHFKFLTKSENIFKLILFAHATHLHTLHKLSLLLSTLLTLYDITMLLFILSEKKTRRCFNVARLAVGTRKQLIDHHSTQFTEKLDRQIYNLCYFNYWPNLMQFNT